MAETKFEGGIHLAFEMRLDADQIARMNPRHVRALLDGVATLATVKYIVDSVPSSDKEGGGKGERQR